jgi:SPP1 gp7 family putative phage head morphogenesis protein
VTAAIDKAIELQLDIQRVAVSAQADVIAVLKRLQRELLAEVAGANYTQWRKARIESQLLQIKRTIADYYGQAAVVAQEASLGIASVASRVTAVSLGVSAVLPSAEVIERAVSNAMILGAPSNEWWSRQSSDAAFKFAQQVRQGIAASETMGQITQRALGVLETSKEGARALVHTSVSTVANDARMAVYEANDDIIKRYRALATLDTHTCLICAPLDGLEWNKDKTPIDHSQPFPTYPKHINCRCLLIGRVTTGEPGGGRAAGGGPVAAKTTFGDWLGRQSKEKQVEILGRGRAELYTSGKITLSDVVNGRGSPLSLKQLQDKYQ